MTALIPNWNGGARLARVIDDLRSQRLQPERILVVDNGSSDGSAEAARTAGCDVIAMGSNMGFAAAVNTGIRDSRTPLVAIINNDVELDAAWLEKLVAAMAGGGAWFAAPKLRSLSRAALLDGSYDLVSSARTAWRCAAGKADAPVWNRGGEIWSAPMTAALFRRTLFDRVGMLDEQFGSYLEDADLGIRCALAGCAGVYVPDAVAGHWGSATLGVWNPETVRLIARNQMLLVWKYRPNGWLSRAGWSILVGQLLWGALAWRHAGRKGLQSWWRGKHEGLAARGRFPHFRNRGEPDRLFAAEQARILELQREGGADGYWRLYFLLTEGRIV
ncbi:MAG: glycosyltransferase family 2 protein [Bryobacteraceae bacterium]